MPNDVQISELTKVTETPNSSDLLLIRHGTVDSKIEYKDLKAAITTNTLFVNPNGVVTQASNPYYNKSEVNSLVSGLQTQIDTLSDKWSLPTITSLQGLNAVLSALPSNGRTSLLFNSTVTNVLAETSTVSTAYATRMDNATADMFLFSISGDFIGTVRYNFSTSTVVKKYDINAMIIHNKYVEIPQNTTTFDIFDGIISSIGSFEGKLFQVQVSSGVVLGGVPVSGGRKLCQILRYSTTNYATILMIGWATDGELYHLIKSNGTWSCTKLPTRAEIDTLNSRMGDDTAAGFHNSIYRGKNITSYLTDTTLWKRITGTGGYTLFQDLYLGDYITVGSNRYAIVDFDYYLRCGDSDITQHHIVMMPVGNMNIPAGTVLYGTSNTLTFINTENAGQTVSQQESATAFKWNATMSAPNTNATAGGYKYSRMRTVIMKAANTIVVNAFGSAHVKPIPVLYYSPNDASASGLASGFAWFNSDDQTNIMAKSICDLPNETQIYGQQVWGQGADGHVGYEIGVDKFQFAIFALQRNFANTRANYWLRSVYSASDAARVYSGGYAGYHGSANALGVRPRFLLVG